MMNDVDLKLIGDKELLAAFRDLDHKTQHKRLHQVLNHVANIPKKAIAAAIPIRNTKISPTGKKWHPPGLAKRSVIKKRGRSKKNAVLFVGPRAKTGDYKTDAYYIRIWDLYSPGKRSVVAAREGAIRSTQNNIYNSMRAVILKAWNKHARR
jgi:hypothetical protein